MTIPINKNSSRVTIKNSIIVFTFLECFECEKNLVFEDPIATQRVIDKTGELAMEYSLCKKCSDKRNDNEITIDPN